MALNDIIINELINGLKSEFNTNLISVILYGSVARGTDSDESDIDIAVIIRNADLMKASEKITDISVELDLKYNKVFSLIDIDLDNFLIWGDILPFYKNVIKDGVILWKAA